jgi:hypothetical protein
MQWKMSWRKSLEPVMRLCSRTAILSILLGGGASIATAEVITATANATVRKGTPDADQDESTRFWVKANGGNGESRFTYLRFNTSGLTIKSNDVIFLDLQLTTFSADASQLDVWALNNNAAGESTWSPTITWNTQPAGIVSLPNASVSAVCSYGYGDTTGQLSLNISASVLQALLTNDTNSQLTFILSNDSGNVTNVPAFASLANTGNYLKPSLRIIRETEAELINESGSGGQLTERSETTFYYNKSTTKAAVGEGNTNNMDEMIQMLLFRLPRRPVGGFLETETSFRLITTTNGNDAATSEPGVDLWGIGYIPASALSSVGSKTNNPSVIDIDDFFFNEAETETKVGWNIGTNTTVKIMDDVATENSDCDNATPLSSTPAVNTTLTSFINDLFTKYGAQEGDYVVLRANYDIDMGNFETFAFYTGDSSSYKPSLTLTRYKAKGTVIYCQ